MASGNFSLESNSSCVPNNMPTEKYMHVHGPDREQAALQVGLIDTLRAKQHDN